ncbi:NAD(P)/FAD-dependent oxidoreductase [Acinetobacter tianfuensis]|uniref:Flavoprotein n=1 Tax=Acinetobacter tianfuensis TaxID=2419603 RepID=A0A3A8EGF8_9GAMM|nr:flavoprotein [Acinetobacter tianfuensis]RKG34017.1 flavoprotein [Acinetobacter tianfuensis]
MVNKKPDTGHQAFKNELIDFTAFKGVLLSSKEVKDFDFNQKNVALIGIDQDTATHLNSICDQAQQVAVFQLRPHFVLPKTERFIHKLIQHPLVIKNRRLFNNRIKSLLALRFLEDQVKDTWLRHLLMPNTANQNKVFLKSDSYYAALQRPNCTLVTWPIMKIHASDVQAINEHLYQCDVIIHHIKLL